MTDNFEIKFSNTDANTVIKALAFLGLSQATVTVEGEVGAPEIVSTASSPFSLEIVDCATAAWKEIDL